MPETEQPEPQPRYHPARWPLAVWVVLALAAEALRVDYTLGAFSFAPAVALLAGTWLGPRRGPLSQVIAVGCIAVVSIFWPAASHANEWGFHIGRILAAMVAGQVATPDENGANPPARTQIVVLAAAFATGVMVVRYGMHSGPGPLGTYFAITFVLAAGIAFVYAWRIVPEPARVLGYGYSLLPYYALGLAWTWVFSRYFQAAAAAEGTPTSLLDILFHGYLAHVPGDVIGIVVISYLVCAVDRSLRHEDLPR